MKIFRLVFELVSFKVVSRRPDKSPRLFGIGRLHNKILAQAIAVDQKTRLNKSTYPPSTHHYKVQDQPCERSLPPHLILTISKTE